MDEIEFVFSFRSPYAWIAARHILPMVDPAVAIRWTPFYPLPSFPNFGKMIPGKARHNVEDILRLTKAYGIRVGRPPVDEDDWSAPHAAFLWADRAGKGPELGLALFDERWEKGEHVCTAETIGRAAESVGLDRDAAVEASEDPKLRAELAELVQANYDERGLFGVPMFVLPDGKRFWGHDRMEWALRYGFVPDREARATTTQSGSAPGGERSRSSGAS